MDSADSSVSQSAGRHTESLVEHFEAAWRSADSLDSRPRIQEYLPSLTEPERSAALRTLLALELKCRLERGEQPTESYYQALFPEETSLIRSVFKETGCCDRELTSSIPPGKPHPTAAELLAADLLTTVDYGPAGAPKPPPVGQGEVVLGDWPAASASTETKKVGGKGPACANGGLPE